MLQNLRPAQLSTPLDLAAAPTRAPVAEDAHTTQADTYTRRDAQSFGLSEDGTDAPQTRATAKVDPETDPDPTADSALVPPSGSPDPANVLAPIVTTTAFSVVPLTGTGAAEPEGETAPVTAGISAPVRAAPANDGDGGHVGTAPLATATAPEKAASETRHARTRGFAEVGQTAEAKPGPQATAPVASPTGVPPTASVTANAIAPAIGATTLAPAAPLKRHENGARATGNAEALPSAQAAVPTAATAPTARPTPPSSPESDLTNTDLSDAVSDVSEAFSDQVRSDVRANDPLRAEPTRTDGNRPELARQIGHQLVDGIRQQRDGTIEISLSPEELGRVRLTLQGSETRLHLTIQSDRPDTESLMRRHIAELQTEFRDQGYTDISFSFGNSASGQAQHFGDPAPQTTDTDSTSQPPLPAGPARAVTGHLAGRNSAAGGLDLRL